MDNTLKKYSFDLDAYLENLKIKSYKKGGANFVIYNKIAYPIIFEINNFFYLGGNNIFLVLKNNCTLVEDNEISYYNVKASSEDILIGKSPIIPHGFLAKENINPKGIHNFQITM